ATPSGEDGPAVADDTGEVVGDDTGSVDSGDSGEEYTEAQVSGVSTRLHEDHENLLYVAWEQGAAGDVWVEYSFDEDVWLTTPVSAVEAGAVEHVLLGIPYGEEVTFRVGNSLGAGPLVTSDASATVGDLPSGFLEATVSVLGDADDSWQYLLTGVASANWSRHWTMIIDRQGRAVWAREADDGVTMYPQLSYAGDELLIDHNTYWGGGWDDGASSEVLRLKIDGTVVENHALPGLHHPFTELPDGSLVWGAANADNSREETLERLWPDGTQETVWSCQELLVEVGANTYCGSNTLFWSEARQTVTFSLYSVETVFEIDVDSGSAVRWFGQLAESWTFDPEESAFWWQHGAHFTADGTFMTSTKISDRGQETLVREYSLDEGSSTLTEVWSFGEG
ncbi:MAG: hypothetical protein GY884_35540, partial [Proteobacteria bacterium]|nr:hypothetical protein [Pseudomonadota bacterium]